MKIYINWEKREWYANKNDIIDDLINDNILSTFSEWLSEEYAGCLDELLELSDSEKKEVKEDYEKDIEREFDENVKNGNFAEITILEINTEKDFNIKEL
jgi:hypothetical protein